MQTEHTDVVVAGGGPTGLALSTALRKAGVDVLTFDRKTDGAAESRAAALHARTLEALNELGVTEKLIAEGVVVPHFTFRERDRLLAELLFSDLPTPYPFILTLQQWRTEQVLTDALASSGGEVLRPYEVTGIDIETDGATVSVQGPDGERRVRARFVVGADGVGSAVRQAAGIEFAGGEYSESFALADAEMDHWPLRWEEVQNFFSPAGIVVSGPLPEGRRRVLATVDGQPELTRDFVQDILDTRGPHGAVIRELHWTSHFHVQHRIAGHFRRGPVFIAGDAAHVHSPAGGQGMNMGIQDAVDLGKVLALELRVPGAGNLDGYEARRRPVAQSTVRLTNFMTRASIVRQRPLQLARDMAFAAVGALPPARRQMAIRMAGLA
jgi:2-polyprenyl-6-methoxyphenol hydroxylase-like FAD-dependent oxidoreductase